MSESFHLSQDIMCPEAFNDVVQELGSEGSELLAAVQGDETVFCAQNQEQIPEDPSRTNPSCESQTRTNHQNLLNPVYPWNYYGTNCRKELFWNNMRLKSEPPEYNEDQKSFIAWNGNQQYESYNEQSMMYAPQTPLTQSIAQIPANVDYAGELEFDILISSHTANRNSWIYSSMLKKVFINMQNVLPVDVKRNPANIDLYLRATLLYSLPQYAQDLVERCSTHVDPRMSTNRDVDPLMMKHVLRCNNPGSVYLGNTELKEHLSVVTPLGQPQAGMDTVRINYQFMCKNSCPSGMNRRAVDVIFTLEDRCGNVLGRRKLAVRVCSCPKRDKEKEEKEFKDSNLQTPTHGRKRKISSLSRPKLENIAPPVNNDDGVYAISLKIFGRQTAENMLKYGRDRLYYEINSGTLDEVKEAKARESLEEINNALRNLNPE